MNKKVMALAVAGAFAVPGAALADASIYGRVNVGFDNYSATGATAANSDIKARNRVFDSASRIGFRANEDLGGGLRAVMVLESGVNFDTGTQATQNGATNPSTGFFATRDSYGGLEGDWGRVTFGRQSIYWVEGVLAQSGANYINADVQTTGAMGRIVGPTARTSNVVAYNSPTMGGFNATVSYAPNSETAAAGANTNAVIEGITLRYNGRVNAQVDWAQNKGATPTTGSATKNSGVKAGIGFPYAPGAQIAVVYISETNDGVAAQGGFTVAGDNVKANGIVVNWEQIFGNIQALAEIGRVAKATGCTETATTTCDNTQSQAFMVGAKYLFSKKTGAYVSYNKITNKSNATWDVSGSGLSGTPGVGSGGALPAAQAGADPRIIAIGIMQNF